MTAYEYINNNNTGAAPAAPQGERLISWEIFKTLPAGEQYSYLCALRDNCMVTLEMTCKAWGVSVHTAKTYMRRHNILPDWPEEFRATPQDLIRWAVYTAPATITTPPQEVEEAEEEETAIDEEDKEHEEETPAELKVTPAAVKASSSGDVTFCDVNLGAAASWLWSMAEHDNGVHTVQIIWN